MFKKPGEESDEEQEDEGVDHDEVGPSASEAPEAVHELVPEEAPRIAQEQQIIIHEDD